MLAAAGEMITAPDPSQVAAPLVAELVRQIMARPPFLATEPLAVDPETYQQAKDQMDEVLRSRGWAGAVAARGLNRPNFLLHGVPVVCAAD